MEGPVRSIHFIHKGISSELAALEEEAAGLSVEDVAALERWAERFQFLTAIVKAHAEGEEADMYPAADERVHRIAQPYMLDHEIEQEISGEIRDLLECARGADVEERARLLNRIRRQAVALNVTLTAHIRKEEEFLVPIIEQHFSVPEQVEMVNTSISYYSEDLLRAGMPWLFRALTPEERLDYLRGLQQGLPGERFHVVKGWIETGVPAEIWRDIVERMPELATA